MIFMGLGVNTVIMAVFLYSLLPIIKNTYTGVKSVDENLIDVAKSMGMSKKQIIMKIEISENISSIRMTKFNIFILLYFLTCSFILLFIIKNIFFSFLLVILIIAFIIYRKILIKKIKGKIKIFITDSGIEMISPKIKKINYSDIKNIAYIQNNSYGNGDIIINISPLKIENKYIDLFSKNDYTFAESINYRTFIIPDAKNVKEIFQKITERKKQNEIPTKTSEDRKRKIKNEIREWSIFFSQRGKNEPLGGYSVKLIPKEMENKKKVEEVKQINIKIDELRNKIVKISTGIYENNIYPF